MFSLFGGFSHVFCLFLVPFVTALFNGCVPDQNDLLDQYDPGVILVQTNMAPRPVWPLPDQYVLYKLASLSHFFKMVAALDELRVI